MKSVEGWGTGAENGLKSTPGCTVNSGCRRFAIRERVDRDIEGGLKQQVSRTVKEAVMCTKCFKIFSYS